MTDNPLSDAAARGDHRALLEALREQIAREIGSGLVPARDLASLSRRLIDISRELNDMPDKEEEDDADRIARERAERRAARSADSPD